MAVILEITTLKSRYIHAPFSTDEFEDIVNDALRFLPESHHSCVQHLSQHPANTL